MVLTDGISTSAYLSIDGLDNEALKNIVEIITNAMEQNTLDKVFIIQKFII